MRHLDRYLNKIKANGNDELATSIQKTAEDVGSRYIETFDFISHEIGLLFGNVQSGKTGQMFGIICKAADLGFPAFLILTTDNNVLQEQTLERVKNDLDDFLVLGENDSKDFADNQLICPVIVVIKKNSRMLKLWTNIFNNTAFMKGNPLFVIDDEADAASLNTLVNKNRQSSINRYIEAIKSKASSSIYLQVTGTPQAIFLQTLQSDFKPYFTYYFEPGKGYLGGDFFFPPERNTNSVILIDKDRDTMENYLSKANGHAERAVVIRHLIVSAQIIGTGGTVSNCLVHPSVRNDVQAKYAALINTELDYLKSNPDELDIAIQRIWNCINPEKSKKLGADEISLKAKELISEAKVILLNQKSNAEIKDYMTGCNFIVGGNTLGRGVTFPALQTIYYTRTSKNPQADTMWQHSRMFGYDRDAGLMTVFIDSSLYKLFRDINSGNNSMIAQIQKGMDTIHVILSEGLRATRSNVLDNKQVEMIPGGTNFYPMNPDNPDYDCLSEMMKVFEESERYYQANLNLIEKILNQVEPSADFNLTAFIGVIHAILAEKPSAQGILIVRRNRNITQGTGALLSPTDWKIGEQFPDQVVLTMYEVRGNGWKKPVLWVPNIKLPNHTVYYDIQE